MSGKRHTIELEIFEGKCSRHEAGQKFKYPEDRGRICQWPLDSAIAMIRVLEYGVDFLGNTLKLHMRSKSIRRVYLPNSCAAPNQP